MEVKAKRQKKKDVVDPVALEKKKFKRKCQFRACVRLAWLNAYWLKEEQDYEGFDDVKKLVAQAVRKPRKKKKLLSLEDKALLNKPAADRTDHEKKYIYRIIGGLKCFSRYPHHVKRKLAAVTYFKYYGPDRVIVRQDHEAFAMYFIVTGGVQVSHLVYDELLQKNIPVELKVMQAGEMFGEVALLHNIPRSATCTTLGHCELLVLMKEDFKTILHTTIQATWNIVNLAMSYFSYFDGLDEVARREGCIVAKMKTYARNDIILGCGHGIPNFVYFILDGRCQMIESLQVVITTHMGREQYSLYDPNVSVTDSDEDYTMLFHTDQKSYMTDIPSERLIEDTDAASSKMHASILKTRSIDKKKSDEKKIDEGDEGEIKKPRANASILSNVQSQSLPQIKSQSLIDARTVKSHDISFTDKLKVSEENREGPRLNFKADNRPANLRTIFMQVCQFNPGSTFGFGENMRDRCIVALNRVDCMLMPIVWLQQRNTANIWTRIKYFLTKKIPDKKGVFQEFVNERRWTKYKDEVVNEAVKRAHDATQTSGNWTSVHDIPYSIRLEEMFDL